MRALKLLTDAMTLERHRVHYPFEFLSEADAIAYNESYIDGRFRREIRKIYADNMFQADLNRCTRLSPAQKAWAQEDWTAQVKIRADASGDRHTVVCQPNYVED